MKPIEIEFMPRGVDRKPLVLLVLSATFFAVASDSYLDSREALQQQQSRLEAEQSAFINGARPTEQQRQRLEQLALDKEAAAHPWPLVFAELEAVASPGTRALSFRHQRESNRSELTIEAIDLLEVQATLDRIRAASRGGIIWYARSVSREPAVNGDVFRAVLVGQPKP